MKTLFKFFFFLDQRHSINNNNKRCHDMVRKECSRPHTKIIEYAIVVKDKLKFDVFVCS